MFEFLKSIFHDNSKYTIGTTAGDDEVYQYSTISSLIEGVYEGTVTYGELRKHGDFGLGTFDELDGEMVAIDGKFYQIKEDGKLYLVSPTQKTPFAVLLHFRPNAQIRRNEPCSYEELQELLNSQLHSNNLVYAIRVDGFFELVRVRVAPRQGKPYKPMTEVARHQPEFEYTNIEGTICGFKFPNYASNLNVPGFHTHFVSADRTVGGHVLKAAMQNLSIQIEQTSGFHVQLPSQGQFLSANLDKDRTKEIEEVER